MTRWLPAADGGRGLHRLGNQGNGTALNPDHGKGAATGFKLETVDAFTESVDVTLVLYIQLQQTALAIPAAFVNRADTADAAKSCQDGFFIAEGVDPFDRHGDGYAVVELI